MNIFKRKIESKLYNYLKNPDKRMVIVDGARQIGKTYTIRHLGKQIFHNYIEINMERDKQHDRLFAEAKTTEQFYLALGAFAGGKMGNRENTLVFIDEIQAYDHLLTLIKFLMEEGRFTYIASGSLLGVTLKKTQSIPVGYIRQIHMYPMDFEEFLWANGVGEEAIAKMRKSFERKKSLPGAIHQKMMEHFRRYLLVGGLPDAVGTYLSEHNIAKVRSVQREILDLYAADAAKYESEARRKLKIQHIYHMIPSYMENRKKRIVVKDIDGKARKRISDYQDEFEYLVSSGIALAVEAVSTPTYPLLQNSGKNLLKLYMNDVGLLTAILYRNDIKPVLEDIRSVNLGSVYETVVAQELRAHGFPLHYFDNKKKGEVDYLVDDVETLSALPIEIKSGKDYTTHRALTKFLGNSDYHVKHALVLSNEETVRQEKNITYMPVYNVIFLAADPVPPENELWF